MHSLKQHFDRKRQLKLWIVVFACALAIPTAFLIRHAYGQLKWEAFHHHRIQAEEFASRVDRRLSTLVASEQRRPFVDYAFLTASDETPSAFQQRSALSEYPVDSAIHGLIGYFQIGPNGAFSSPILPFGDAPMSRYGIPDGQAEQRRRLHQRIFDILDENRLVRKAHAGVPEEDPGSAEKPPPEAPVAEREARPLARNDLHQARVARPDLEDGSGQAAFDRLGEVVAAQRASKKEAATLGRVEDLLKLKREYQPAVPTAPAEPQTRIIAPVDDEQVVGTERAKRRENTMASPLQADARARRQVAEAVIEIFESAIGLFEFALLDSGHFVLFRNVWRSGERFVQGALVDSARFVSGVIEAEYRETALASVSDLVVAYGGEVISGFRGQSSRGYLSRADELQGTLLLKTRLSSPLDGMELIFSIARLPVGPGGAVIVWVSLILSLVLAAGSYLLYRTGSAQIELVRQQQDFMSAVSHELKTPLTSIRMYSEMLKEGWADEDKKSSYYRYISEETERLSRLISNVLQLTRLNRNGIQLETKPVRVDGLIENAGSKIDSQVRSAGFELNLNIEKPAATSVILADPDAFMQIVINLVDNAIKFSAGAHTKRIDINCTRQRGGDVRIQVRDYGPGVPKSRRRDIFKLFYRSGDELTRETTGTGIGLALVKQLMHAMHGRVDVLNRDPGAEFVLVFPTAAG
jgi:signal transduction histidine kinase